MYYAHNSRLWLALKLDPVQNGNGFKLDIFLLLQHIDDLQHATFGRCSPNAPFPVADVLRKRLAHILDHKLRLRGRNAMLGEVIAVRIIPCKEQ